jgi:Putative polyhydroxyalkanoic acid system protein (PHA_gran_rgn)
MAKPVVVTIEHGSSKGAVKAKLAAGLDEIRGRLGPLVGAVEQEWAGDALHFRLAALGQPVTGRIDVDDLKVRIEVLLPGLLGYLGDRIAGRVQREGALLLDNKKDKS